MRWALWFVLFGLCAVCLPAPAGDASRNKLTARLPRAISTDAPVARVLVFMVLPSVRRDVHRPDYRQAASAAP